MVVIVRTKRDIAAYVKAVPVVVEAKAAYEEDAPGSFDEVETELVKLIAVADGSPDFGEDWGRWLEANVEELLQEAVSIVM